MIKFNLLILSSYNVMAKDFHVDKDITIHTLANQISIDKQKYGYFNKEQDRQKITRALRRMLGKPNPYKAPPHMKNISKHELVDINKSAPLMYLNNGGNVELYEDNRGEIMVTKLATGQKSKYGGVVLNGRDVKSRQQKVELYFDETKISPTQVRHIQELKAGKRIKINEIPKQYKDFLEYKKELERLSSYVVIRGEVIQPLNAKGEIQNPPNSHPIIYATYPKIRKGSADYELFTDGHGNLTKPDELKKKYIEILKLQAKIAIKHGEAIDTVTPNAFLSGLSNQDKVKAKQLFAEAVIDVAKELQHNKNFKGFLVHDNDKEFQTLLQKDTNKKLLIAINPGDSLSPNIAGGKNLHVASVLAAEGIGAVGNGGASDWGSKGNDERDSRVTAGDTSLIFSPAINYKLLNEKNYISINKTAGIDKTININNKVKIYSANNPKHPDQKQVALEFTSTLQRDEFIADMKNKGKTNNINLDDMFFTTPSKPNTMYIRSSNNTDDIGAYKAKNGELAISFGNMNIKKQEIASYFYSKLNLASQGKTFSIKGAVYFDRNILPPEADHTKQRHIETNINTKATISPSLAPKDIILPITLKDKIKELATKILPPAFTKLNTATIKKYGNIPARKSYQKTKDSNERHK